MSDPITFEQLVPPWSGWDKPSDMPADQVIERLDKEVAAARTTDAGRIAAAGLVVAVGNYELMGEKRRAILDRASALLAELDPDRSRYWG